jgi:hypothetical protein
MNATLLGGENHLGNIDGKNFQKTLLVLQGQANELASAIKSKEFDGQKLFDGNLDISVTAGDAGADKIKIQMKSLENELKFSKNLPYVELFRDKLADIANKAGTNNATAAYVGGLRTNANTVASNAFMATSGITDNNSFVNAVNEGKIDEIFNGFKSEKTKAAFLIEVFGLKLHANTNLSAEAQAIKPALAEIQAALPKTHALLTSLTYTFDNFADTNNGNAVLALMDGGTGSTVAGKAALAEMEAFMKTKLKNNITINSTQDFENVKTSFKAKMEMLSDEIAKLSNVENALSGAFASNAEDIKILSEAKKSLEKISELFEGEQFAEAIKQINSAIVALQSNSKQEARIQQAAHDIMLQR